MPLVLVRRTFIKHSKGRVAACVRGVAPCSCRMPVLEKLEHARAHGTSTSLNDSCETAAIKTVFGPRAYEIDVSSTKSMTGYLLGAAGAVEAVLCAQVLRDGAVPPTINYREADPACDLDYVTEGARRMPVRYALSNSLGFGGHNACLLFKKWEG